MERPQFDRLLTAHFAEIEATARKYATIYGQLNEWEDLMQSAILKMLRFADLYDPDKGKLLSWACAVILNTIKTRIAQSIAVPYMDEVTALTPAVSDSNPENDLQVSLILSNLNEETRLYTEGYNYVEIAALCGFRSKVTAKNRIDLCAGNLRRVLGETRAQCRRTRIYTNQMNFTPRYQ